MKKFNLLVFTGLLVLSVGPTVTAQTVHHPQLSISTYANIPSDREVPVNLTELPNGNLAYATLDGEIYELTEGSGRLLFSVDDHQLPYVSGMEAQGDYMYLCGSVEQPGGDQMIGYVMKGHIPTNTWTVLAESDPHYFGRSFRDHRFSSLLISLDGRHVYVHCGTRTNAGEVHELDGIPATQGLRWEPLRGKIFKLPTDAPETIHLSNDSTELANSGYVYASGLRHVFALDWGPDGVFYAASNSDRRDVGEAFYKIMEGRHYGFPWWIGGEQNPIQFPDYDPAGDLLLPSNANRQGYYNNDPDFPPMPADIAFVQPYKNIGPDGDLYRDPQTGKIRDASEDGVSITTFTPHRSPTGLIFDRAAALPDPFTHEGFMVCYTNGGNLLNNDGHDLLQITLMNEDTLSATRLVSGFIRPIDVHLKDGRLYLMDYGNSNGTGRKIFEITFSTVSPAETVEKLNADIGVFPNPARDLVYFDIPEGLRIQGIRVYDQSGKNKRYFSGEVTKIDISEWSPDLYLLEFVIDEKRSVIRKLIKTK